MGTPEKSVFSYGDIMGELLEVDKFGIRDFSDEEVYDVGSESGFSKDDGMEREDGRLDGMESKGSLLEDLIMLGPGQ